MGTLSAILILLYFYTGAPQAVVESPGAEVAVPLLLLSIILFLGQIATCLFSWNPLLKAEKLYSPRLSEVFCPNRFLFTSHLLLLIFPLFSAFVAFDISLFHTLPVRPLLLTWVLAFGLYIDLFFFMVRYLSHLFNPFHFLETGFKLAQGCIRTGNEEKLCDWIDAMTEVSTLAIQRQQLTLSTLSLDKLREIGQDFVRTAKSFAFRPEKSATQESDDVGFVLFYLFQRLEMIFNVAQEKNNEVICNEVIKVLGKIVIECANYDLSVATYPLHYLGKCALRGQKSGLFDIGPRATLTLQEVSKQILSELDIRYLELQDPFMTILGYMKRMAKETFRKDKEIDLKLLMQPFQEMKKLFEEEKVASHQDAPVILKEINQIIEEFQTLDTILKTMPPVGTTPPPEFPKES